MKGEHSVLVQIIQQLEIRDEDGRLLIVPHEAAWNLPGGRIRLGESWHDSLLRHASQQTGIVNLRDLRIKEIDLWSEHGETFYSVLFSCQVPEFARSLMVEQSIPHAWIALQDLDNFLFSSERSKFRAARLFSGAPCPS